MSWNWNNESLHQHTPRNYMADGVVYIQDEINEENCAFLIGDMHKYVMSEENSGKELNIVINTPGGSVDVMNQISAMITIAKLRNIKVVTWVFGWAASAGSLIAVQGDDRWMARNAVHMIHFGSMIEFFTKETELTKSYKFNQEYAKRMQKIYLDHCPKLTPSKLKELEEDEMGRLWADECLKLGICDHIIEDDYDEKVRQENESAELLSELLKMKKQKNAKKKNK